MLAAGRACNCDNAAIFARENPIERLKVADIGHREVFDHFGVNFSQVADFFDYLAEKANHDIGGILEKSRVSLSQALIFVCR